MARQRKYDDPISIPFTFEVKGRIEKLAEERKIAQADVVRDIVDAGLKKYEQRGS